MPRSDRTLRISYSYDAWGSWDSAVEALTHYFVRVMPKGGGAPFDCYIVGALPESELIGEIQVIRGTPSGHDGGPVENVQVEKIHVY